MMDTSLQVPGKSKRYIIFITFAFFTSIMVYITNKEDVEVETDETYYWQSSLLSNNISCVYEDKEDSLPSTEGFTPKEKSIYFHETSCRNGLNSREACAVESAARAHPNWQINVLFASSITADVLNSGSLAALQSFKNVKLLRLHVKNLKAFKILADKIIKYSVYPVEQLSHLLRFVSLWNWGGVYLDLDVIVVRSFETLPRNWVARQTDKAIGSAILAFSRDQVGRNFSEAILRETNMSFVPADWGYTGSDAITKVFRNKCTARKPADWSARTCQGFHVFEPTSFYPVLYYQSKIYLRDGHLRTGGVYTHHMWNEKTKGDIVHKKSPYAKLARRFCPTIYKIFGETFGDDGV